MSLHVNTHNTSALTPSALNGVTWMLQTTILVVNPYIETHVYTQNKTKITDRWYEDRRGYRKLGVI
jgi:hypothetical protein